MFMCKYTNIKGFTPTRLVYGTHYLYHIIQYIQYFIYICVPSLICHVFSYYI